MYRKLTLRECADMLVRKIKRDWRKAAINAEAVKDKLVYNTRKKQR